LNVTNNFNQGLVGDDVLTAAERLVSGRCGATGQASAQFSGELATRIQDIDNDNDMRYIYSFDASWSDDLDTWKTCKQQQFPNLKAELLSQPGVSRAAMITNEFNIPCANWAFPKGPGNPSPDYQNNCCGPAITPTPVQTPTPTPTF